MRRATVGLLGCWVVLLVACGGGGSGGGPAPRAAIPDVGVTETPTEAVDETIYQLHSPQGGKVLVCVDRQALNQAIQLSVKKDIVGIGNLMAGGRMFTVEAGTRAKVIQREPFASTVRIIDGVYSERTGLVLTEHLSADGDRQPPATPERQPEPPTVAKPIAPPMPPPVPATELAPAPAGPSPARIKQAATLLDLAKDLLATKKEKAGRERLQRIVDEYADTPAAEEAKEILKTK